MHIESIPTDSVDISLLYSSAAINRVFNTLSASLFATHFTHCRLPGKVMSPPSPLTMFKHKFYESPPTQMQISASLAALGGRVGSISGESTVGQLMRRKKIGAIPREKGEDGLSRVGKEKIMLLQSRRRQKEVLGRAAR